MELANSLTLLLGGLILLSIVAGLVSSRSGAPLLLVFLGLGMLLGEDGPGGLVFADFNTAYVVGSIALAIILFDGGFRTPLPSVRVAWGPAAVLATVGVILTAIFTGVVAALVFDGGWLQGFLIASTVASTDAAAVFLLLHQRGMELKKRLSATLEIESGANDPMAILLTISLVHVVLASDEASSFLGVVQLFAQQFTIGIIIGLVAGYLIAAAVNRLDLASGLYPVFVLASALFIFGGTQSLGGSGFVAVYLAGIVAGNRRMRANKLIRRFHDGIAWVSQILMFVMLGLLVTPSKLLDDLLPTLIVALALVFLARPLAVYLCLLPFRFSKEERLFIAWVGLRGAVPIFLAVIPVLSGVPNSMTYFNVAFSVVLVSLILQGWTIPWLARRLHLELPPRPEPRGRLDIDLLGERDRDMTAYRVSTKSPICSRATSELVVPEGARVLALLREDQVLDLEGAETFRPRDALLVICPPERSFLLDRQFEPRLPTGPHGLVNLGDFGFSGATPMGALAAMYGLEIDSVHAEKSVGRFLRERLGPNLSEGDAVALGDIELVVRELVGGEVYEVGLRLEPEPPASLVVRLSALAEEAERAVRIGTGTLRRTFIRLRQLLRDRRRRPSRRPD